MHSGFWVRGRPADHLHGEADMPLVGVRLDNRLIHAQVLALRSVSTQVDRIIVSNDRVADDALQVALLKAIPTGGAVVSVLCVEECAKYCLSVSDSGERILVIVKFPEDALALARADLPFRALDLGNQSFVRGSRKLGDSLYFTHSGVIAMADLHAMGIRIACRTVFSDSDADCWSAFAATYADWLSEMDQERTDPAT